MRLKIQIHPLVCLVWGMIPVVPITACRENPKVEGTTPRAESVETPAPEAGPPAEVVAPPIGQRSGLNLAKHQPIVSSVGPDDRKTSLITDGNYATAWTAPEEGSHELVLDLPVEATLGSAHLYLGEEADPEVSIEWWNGSAWQAVDADSAPEGRGPMRVLDFAEPVSTRKLRLVSQSPGLVVRELALFAPVEADGWPLGTDVTLNLAKKRRVIASSVEAGHHAKFAVDGYAGDRSSAWRTGAAETANHLEVELPEDTRIGALHLFSGSPDDAPVAEFSLQRWDDGQWQDIPGAAVMENTEPERALEFDAVSASKVRLVLPAEAGQTIRELVLLPPGPGLALGTDVFRSNPPTTRWGDLSDSYYRVVNAASGRALGDTEFQLLYNYANDSYRIRNRETLECLAAASLDPAPGGAVVESDYHAMPHEMWRVSENADGTHRLLNLWNAHALGASEDGKLTLRPPDAESAQAWRFEFVEIFPKKGLADVRNNFERLKVSWEYNWTREPRLGALPEDIAYCPMWWNTVGMETQPLYYSKWQRDARPFALLGFNEPDLTIESNMTPEQAVAAWPVMEAADLPLLSPAPATSLSGWMDDFHERMEAEGYRTDFYGAHCYLDPFPDALIGYLTEIHKRWGKPVWLTEFAGYDTSGHAHYTEEQHYRFLAEFLWRAEGLPWLERYSIFPFFIDPAPHPWEPTPDRRTAMFDASGTRLTAPGELYAAWDADRTIRPGTAYLLTNQAAMFRIASTDSDQPSAHDIRASDTKVQWFLEPVEGTDRFEIVSLWDGRKLAWDGEAVALAASEGDGDAVEWLWTADPEKDAGNFFIDHAASGKRLRMDRLPETGAPESVTLSMSEAGTVEDATRWRFIKPLHPGNPSGPLAVKAAAAETKIHLRWASRPDVSEYEVKRSTSPDGPFETIATVAEPAHVDEAVEPGIRHHYRIALAGREASDSAPVSATAGWVENPGFESPATDGFTIAPAGAAWSFGSPGGQNQAGISTNGSGYTDANPDALQGSQVAFLQGTGRMSQQLSGFVAGRRYEVGFLAAQRGSFQGAGQTWKLMLDGEVIAEFSTPKEETDFRRHSASFTPSTSAPVISFVGTNGNGGDNTVLIDDVRIRLRAD